MTIGRIDPLNLRMSIKAQEQTLKKEAQKRGMELRIFDNTAVVNTDEAQWLIIDSGNGFELYHENVSCKNERYSDDYHLQSDMGFGGPMSILLYIYNHDIAHVKRYSETHRGA